MAQVNGDSQQTNGQRPQRPKGHKYLQLTPELYEYTQAHSSDPHPALKELQEANKETPQGGMAVCSFCISALGVLCSLNASKPACMGMHLTLGHHAHALCTCEEHMF